MSLKANEIEMIEEALHRRAKSFRSVVNYCRNPQSKTARGALAKAEKYERLAIKVRVKFA